MKNLTGKAMILCKKLKYTLKPAKYCAAIFALLNFPAKVKKFLSVTPSDNRKFLKEGHFYD